MDKDIFLFVDFDDTLSRQSDLTDQYVDELSRLLPGELTKGQGDWGTAILNALQNSLTRYQDRFQNPPFSGFKTWIVEERARALMEICREMNVPPPRSESPAELASRMQFEALTSCNAAFPDAGSILQELFEMGVRIQMASSQESQYLLAALIGAGIESYTESKFGPDIVDCAKEGAEFYRLITKATGVNPTDAFVLDDRLSCLNWAREAGIKHLIWLCSDKPNSLSEDINVISSLSELPKLILSLTQQTGMAT